MSKQDTALLQHALATCFRDEAGDISPSGRLVLNWLRDVVCEWKDDPLNPQVYSGDLLLHGATLGRQAVYTRLVQEMNLAPEFERIMQLQDALRREKEHAERLISAEEESDDV